MRMRPILVAAVCSAGAALVLILSELGALGATHHIGGTTNSGTPGPKSPSQVSSGESVVRGPYRFDQVASGSDTQNDDQSVAEASPNGGDGQSTPAGLIQQTLSNAAAPITLGPIGR